MLEQLFGNLGRFVFVWRWWVIAVWLVVTAVATVGAAKLPTVLSQGGDAPRESDSALVNQRLARDFQTPFAHSAVLVVSGEPTSIQHFLTDARDVLKSRGEVREVVDAAGARALGLHNQSGRHGFLLLGLEARTFDAAKDAMPRLRLGLEPLIARAKSLDPSFDAAITGAAAIDLDVGQLSSKSSAEAEARVLPILLSILLLAFGSLVSAGVPLVSGVVATTVALGLGYLAACAMPLSPFLQNIATMLGLGIGIDYALLLVSRYREELMRREPCEALAQTLATAGVAIAASGFTVLIGLLALAMPQALETTSIGVGGVLVVAVSLISSLTFLPAVLAVAGPRINVGRFPWQAQDHSWLWQRWTRWVMRHRGKSLVAALVLVLGLAWPATGIRLGLPDSHWVPVHTEAGRGLEGLEQMGLSTAILPIQIVVTTTVAGPALSSQTVDSLMTLSRRLAGLPQVKKVLSPVDLSAGLTAGAYHSLYRDVPRVLGRYPAISQHFLSKSHDAVLMQVLVNEGVRFSEMKALVKQIRRLPCPTGLTFTVGGPAAMNLDLDERLLERFPWMVAAVILVTFAVLYGTFRSVLIPLKATLLNLLSVAASYGAITWVFQEGHGGHLFGLAQPALSVATLVPSITFCVVYGLSMDYEVFLMSRIAEAHRAGQDDETAIAEGVGAVGRLITAAALIMTVAFGAFAFSEIILVQMLGFGLAVAVLVDATVIRALLVPALMRVAGRWNWWPG